MKKQTNGRKQKTVNLEKILEWEKRMNDFCPYIYECKNQEYNWECFGRYESCGIYKNKVLNNRENSNNNG